MKLQKDQQLFFGCKIDSKMRESLAQARPGDRKYFESDSDEFLRICTFEQEKWIGKVLKVGINVGEIEDIHRNVASILRRISPNIRASASSVKVFHVVPDDSPVSGEDTPAPEPEHGGPYIDY
ncbi:MAG: hypothetical protein GY811_01405 [Myxococcales bacterium]|nr:hypothetical protein [Myxococcales bacterium]